MKSRFFDPNRPEDDFKIRIDKNGTWFHDGVPMERTSLQRLFATALYYDPDQNEYWLITPHEQGRIMVEDVPYLITDYEWTDDSLTLVTNLGHHIHPNKDNPIMLKNNLPYCKALNDVPARLNRMVRDKLIDTALLQNGYNESDQTLYLLANRHVHPLARS